LVIIWGKLWKSPTTYLLSVLPFARTSKWTRQSKSQ
jgi:hypothetical protein